MRKIWLIRTGEPLPSDGDIRLFRMGLIAKLAAENPENQVIWWCSTFDHFRKVKRMEKDGKIQIQDNYALNLIYANEYRSNLSFGRLWHQFVEGKKFVKWAEKKEDLPDIIFCAVPTLEWAYYAAKFAKKHNIPIFIDLRDMFPDMYVDFCKPKMKPLVKIGIVPYQIMLALTLKRAKGIVATSEKFLAWGLKYAGRERGSFDRVYYVSYPDNNVPITEGDLDFWYEKGVSKDDFVCCFFGKFGYTVDLETVMRAAVKIEKINKKIKFVICGVGEKIDIYKKIVSGTKNVIFPGWVNRVQICALGIISSVGLLAYRPGKNYEYSMPNKFCEYLALGQALVIQPKGMMLDYATQYQCGVPFSDEDDLVSQLMMLESDREMTDQMKKKSRELYEKFFCAEKVYNDLEKFIEENAKMH